MKRVLFVMALTLLSASAAYAGPPPPTQPVPEPGTLMLLGGGLAGIAGLGLFRKFRK